MTVSGILNVDKPLGQTSFDVVRRVKRGTGERKVGHAGTLDPAATGVLLVCLGQAVRVSEYLMDLPKTYRAAIHLGISTDTYDSEGQVVATGAPDAVSEEALRQVLQRFVGEIQQVPPRYSAIKVGGRPAYQRARKGEALVLSARPVKVYRLDLLDFAAPIVELEIECGKGTYIRSLAHDIGQQLGCGAYLARLARTRVGPFTLESAVGGADLEQALTDGSWRTMMLPVDCGLIGLPAVTLHIEDEKDVRHGQAVHLDEAQAAPLGQSAPGRQVRAYAEDGSLVGILSYDGKLQAWRPRKVFPVT
jgi:tRNA pseudouridine55 synthase